LGNLQPLKRRENEKCKTKDGPKALSSASAFHFTFYIACFTFFILSAFERPPLTLTLSPE
jgi:hypothetical protein